MYGSSHSSLLAKLQAVREAVSIHAVTVAGGSGSRATGRRGVRALRCRALPEKTDATCRTSPAQRPRLSGRALQPKTHLSNMRIFRGSESATAICRAGGMPRQQQGNNRRAEASEVAGRAVGSPHKLAWKPSVVGSFCAESIATAFTWLMSASRSSMDWNLL